MKKNLCILIFVLLGINYAAAQNRIIDSLKTMLNAGVEDTGKVIILNQLCRQLDNSGEHSKALYYSNAAIELGKKLRFKSGVANALKNSGNSYFNQSNFPKALEYYLSALKLFEEMKDKPGIGKCLGSLGNVYQHQLDFTKSLDYYLQALEKFEELGNKLVIAKTYNNIGEVYRHQFNYKKALEYYFKGLNLFNEIGDKQEKGNCYNNIGLVYTSQNELAKGIDFYTKALKIREEIGDKQGIGTSYNNLGEVLSKVPDYKLALKYCDSGLIMNKQIEDLDLLRTSYENIAGIYFKTGNYKEAYINYTEFKHLTDSIFSNANSKKLSDLKTNFEVEKKEAELKLKSEAQQAVANEEKKRQQLIIYIAAIMLIVVIVFAAFMFNRYKITHRQKHIIEKQKEIVEESQKHTIDSINYAKRIQLALLTSEKYIGTYLREFFIVFKPKDIVSGDFYCAVYVNDKFYLATADCTGHGVPGALMSMLGISFLNEIIVERKISDPAKILDRLREEIITALNQEGSSEESTDGMDMSLCCFDFFQNTLEYACANNGLCIVRNNEVIQVKADKMPVGKYMGDLKPFTAGKMQLQANDMVYAYTDGYADQFGGPKGKKYNYRQFVEKLLKTSGESANEQKAILLTEHEEWKGNLEQVDDITIIGVRI